MKRFFRAVKVFAVYAVSASLFIAGMQTAYRNCSRTEYAEPAPPFEVKKSDGAVTVNVFGEGFTVSGELFRELFCDHAVGGGLLKGECLDRVNGFPPAAEINHNLFFFS